MTTLVSLGMPQTAANDRAWRDTAPCTTASEPDLWFPDDETDAGATATAKAVCAECPVRSRCLDEAMLAGDEYGIWGGLTTAERAASRTSWVASKGGGAVVRAARDERGLISHTSSALDDKFLARQRAAKAAWANAQTDGEFARRDDCLAVLKALLANPTLSSERIAQRMGVSRCWFNSRKREVFRRYDVSDVA